MEQPKYIEKYMQENPSGYSIATIQDLRKKYGKRIISESSSRGLYLFACGIITNKSGTYQVYPLIEMKYIHLISEKLRLELENLNLLKT